jgi:hypothetical protein
MHSTVAHQDYKPPVFIRSLSPSNLVSALPYADERHYRVAGLQRVVCEMKHENLSVDAKPIHLSLLSRGHHLRGLGVSLVARRTRQVARIYPPQVA